MSGLGKVDFPSSSMHVLNLEELRYHTFLMMIVGKRFHANEEIPNGRQLFDRITALSGV
jgi:hypothetical protein